MAGHLVESSTPLQNLGPTSCTEMLTGSCAVRDWMHETTLTPRFLLFIAINSEPRWEARSKRARPSSLPTTKGFARTRATLLTILCLPLQHARGRCVQYLMVPVRL